MREDPIISGGIVKLALVLLVVGGLGVGAYALAEGGIDLPSLPEIDTIDGSTNLENTTIEDTTLGEEPEPAAPPEAFTTAGLGDALATVMDAVGDVELTRVTVNEVQTQFTVRRDEGIESYSVRADSGDLARADAEITISGDATIDDFAFPLAAVRASALDRMLAEAQRMSGAPDFAPTVLTLERAIASGDRDLRWTISAEGGGKLLTYRARADGGGVEDIGGGGTAIPPAAQEARKLNDCIKDAGNDTDAIFACLERFSD
jgi:hypothetical protein